MSTDKKVDQLGFWSVVSIGIGGMVGGGIFAVLGLAVHLSGSRTPIAFAIAGIVALLTSYSYVKLSLRYPSKGGTVEFLNQAFGTGLITGSLNILLWLSYIAMLGLYSYAFGSYGASLLPSGLQVIGKHVFITAIVLLMTGINILNTKIVGESERIIVALKLLILLGFIGIGVFSIQTNRLPSASLGSNPIGLVAGGMIIFLAYEGFELIANTAQDVRNPKKTLPRAYYTSVIFVIILYVLIAIVAIGNLPLNDIVAAQDYALADAAKPFLGKTGFILIAIAAMLSTGSAINATLYGSSRVSYIIAKDGELPEELENKIWKRPIEGLLITAAATIILANIVDLSSISLIGSSGFLIIFAMVNISNVYLAKYTGAKRWLAFLSALACIVAFGFLFWQTVTTDPLQLLLLAGLFGLSFAIEFVYRFFTGRSIIPYHERVHLKDKK